MLEYFSTRNNSALALSQFAESAAAVNRVVVQHCRSQLDCHSSSFAGMAADLKA